MADRKGQQSGRGGASGQGQGGRAAQGGRGAQGNRPAPPARAAQSGAPARRERREDLPPPPTGPRPTPRLRTRYDDEVRAALIQEFGYRNLMQAPKIDKVVINIGLGEALTDSQ